jgi:hypothetical protein
MISIELQNKFMTILALLTKIIANCKKVFKKMATRVEIFKIEVPGVCLSPDPIITIWNQGLILLFITVKI